ncbi:MAG: FAD-dependent oxidoreductase [Candidatus Zapsychrus exili]|nr:FAD-dependent oxidoreductase [Candidatus Zapsychrus exili]
MKKIVVLGNSAASIKALEKIRLQDNESELTIIPWEAHQPYNSELLPKYLASSVSQDDISCRPQEFYQTNRINVVLDKKIVRVNFNKKKLFTEDKEQIDYDLLVIASAPCGKLPDIKGANKDGVYDFKNLDKINEILSLISITETIVVRADNFSGLQAAMAFAENRKEVILVSSDRSAVSSIINSEEGDWLLNNLKGLGIRFIGQESISEILGDSYIKAVRLGRGKVIATQILVFCDAKEDLRMFAGLDIGDTGKIKVNEQFQTNLEDVFAIGNTCECSDGTTFDSDFLTLSESEYKGDILASKIMGQDQKFESKIQPLFAKTEDFSIISLCDVEKDDSILEVQKLDEDSGVLRKVFVKDETIVGAVLINCDHEKDRFLKLIEERKSVSSLEDFVGDGAVDLSFAAEDTENKEISESV